jgi:hypothetical protein
MVTVRRYWWTGKVYTPTVCQLQRSGYANLCGHEEDMENASYIAQPDVRVSNRAAFSRFPAVYRIVLRFKLRFFSDYRDNSPPRSYICVHFQTCWPL